MQTNSNEDLLSVQYTPYSVQTVADVLQKLLHGPRGTWLT